MGRNELLDGGTCKNDLSGPLQNFLYTMGDIKNGDYPHRMNSKQTQAFTTSYIPQLVLLQQK